MDSFQLPGLYTSALNQLSVSLSPSILLVPPINVEVEAIGSTWIILSWEPVVTSAGVLIQLVLVSGGGTEYNVTVDSQRAKSNITNLDAGVMYSMRVVTVAEDGQMSFPSLSALAMTQISCTFYKNTHTM